MNLIFNELSFYPLLDNEQILKTNFLQLLKLFKHLKENENFNYLIFPSNIGELEVTNEKTFLQWAYGINSTSEKNNILSFIKRPFTKEVLEEEYGELSKYYYENKELNIKETYCSGLATSYIKNFICTSLSSNSVWDETSIGFYKIVNDDFDTETVSTLNISKDEHLNDVKIKKQIENITEIKLDETEINSTDKKISLRNDHGKDKLLEFSKRLVKSKYVISVINSLPFNPKSINLIKEIYPDGKIEIVLYWENAGYGIIIQTTGKTFKETELIAKTLKRV